MRRLALVLMTVGVAFAGVAGIAGSADAAASNPLAKVTVTGAAGTQPTVAFAKPFAVSKTVHVVATPGTGAPLAKGQVVTFNYLIVDGRTGKQVETSYDEGKTPQRLALDTAKTAMPLVKGLVGAPVGSRVLLAIAPKDGLAKKLKATAVKKDDTLLFVLDVTAATTPLTRATGAAVAPVAGLPTVALDSKGAPTITVPPGAAAPSTLVVQPLIVGTGPVVTTGQTITTNYTGAIWATGKVFDSSWTRGQTIDFPIGTGSVISGWDKGLVGQTVGSQVLLVVPPAEGYGSAGSSSAGISGTDTLVFVVDILAAS